MGGPNALLASVSIPLVVQTAEQHAGSAGCKFTDRFGEALPR